MNLITVLGLCAAILTTGAFLPQAIKVIMTRQTKDLSLTMYAMLVIGLAVWAAYGIIRQDMPVAFANIVALCFNTLILILKIKYK